MRSEYSPYLIYLVPGLIFVLTLIMLELGRRMGLRRMTQDPEGARAGTGAVEGAVFALFGLLLAFSFTGAAARFETRRDLIVEHANAIGTAWLRLDLLPKEVQPEIRKQFRQYVDVLIKVPHLLAENPSSHQQIAAQVFKFHDKIWPLAEIAAPREGSPQVASLVLPALNEMFDLGSKRYATALFHTSEVILLFLFVLSLLASLLAGYAMGAAKRRNLLHMLIFASLVSLTLFVIFDFEMPRFGFINLDKADQILVDLRKTM
jgi:hypothetical protein